MVKPLLRRAVTRLGYEIHRKRKAEPITGLARYRDLFPAESLEAKRFYNLGASGFRHPYWTNVDHLSDWYREALAGTEFLDVDFLAREVIPVEDGMAELVYTSHTIEHLSDGAALHLLREAHRLLKPRGLLRVTAPDSDLAVAAYRRGDRLFFRGFYDHPNGDPGRGDTSRVPADATLPQLFLYQVASPISTLHGRSPLARLHDAEVDALFAAGDAEAALDHCTARCHESVQRRFPGDHVSWWNERKLARFLRDAGFTEVHPSRYGQSLSPVLRDTRFFDGTFPAYSFYVDAVK